MPFHIYFHMPYCRRRCPYCDFYKKVPKDGDLARLAATLKTEIGRARDDEIWAKGPAETVYFGGGTPSLHLPQEIGSVLDATGHEFGIMPQAEITLEANPGTVTKTGLTELWAAGVNRISLGGQSFSPRKLAQLFRDHTAEEIGEAFQFAQAAGFKNISLDLIFGLPGEGVAEWEQDLDRALELSPSHISLYNLEYHEGTPLFRWRARGQVTPLIEDVEFELYMLAHDRLTAAGYEHYEVSNFARPGFQSRHNSAYWSGSPYLGLGPSAHSFDGVDRRFANVADVEAWRFKVENGETPVEREWIATERERMEEWISLGLRRNTGLKFVDAKFLLGEHRATQLWNRASELPDDSREIIDTELRLTARGWFRENSILLWLYEGTWPANS